VPSVYTFGYHIPCCRRMLGRTGAESVEEEIEIGAILSDLIKESGGIRALGSATEDPRPTPKEDTC
jgi:hypothetical protein